MTMTVPDLHSDALSAAALRIGLFTESFHPVQNGVTTSVLTLVAGLRAQGHHACIFAPAHQEQRETEVNVLRFPSFVTLFNRDYPVAYPFFPRLALTMHFQRLRFDIVHTHTPFVLGMTGANLARRHEIPLITTYHTLYSQYSHYNPLLPDSVTQTLLDYYLPWYYNRCTEIICPSEVAAQTLRNMGVERPITVIPTGIPLPPPEAISAEARREERAARNIPPDAPLLLYAGRMAREKNLDWLLEVFARVRARAPDALLVLAGSGPYLEELEEMARSLHLEETVFFLGAVPRHCLDSLFAAADVFCFPSPSETQGLVIGEARAAGTPCVVVDSGGAPETVRDGEDGFRVPPEDKEAFAERILQIIEDASLRARMRANALRNAHNFTPEQMVRQVLEVYERARSQFPLHRDLQAETVAEELHWEAIGQSFRENSDEAGRK